MAAASDVLDVMHELVAFVRVAEAGSFSAAARQHGMTPSAMSRQVARLEKAMGISLLRRTTRQLHLTEAGQAVLARGQEMVAAAQASLHAAEGLVEAPRGRVRISAPKAYARHVLQPALLDFAGRYPDIDLHVMVTDRPVDPLREGVDVAVRLTDDPPPGLVARALAPVRQYTLASPDYLAERDPIRVPEDLLSHSCLTLGEHEGDSRWRFVRGSESVEVNVGGRYTVNHSEMRLQAVEAGLGIGSLPDFVAHRALAAGRLVQVLPDWTFFTNYQGVAYLLYAPSRQMPPKIRLLIDHLLANVRPVPFPCVGAQAV